MGIRSRFAAVVGGGLLVTSLLLGGTAGAYVPPVDATGTVHCATIATLKFKPALKSPGTSQPTTITLKTTLSSCGGTGGGANVVSGKSVGVTHTNSNDCTTQLESTGPSTPGDIKWKIVKHTPRITPSTIQFTAASEDDGPPIVQTSTGTATAGSFHGDGATSTARIQETRQQLIAACLSKSGLKIVHIVTGSTFTLTSGS